MGVRFLAGLATASWLGMVSPSAAADWPIYAGVSYGIASVDGTVKSGAGPVFVDPGEVPDSLPIDGLPFDDDSDVWSVFAGYEINQYVGIELGFTDLGEFDSSANMGSRTIAPTVGMESLSLGARLQYPLTQTISATWKLGVARTNFDVDGSTFVLVPVAGFNPFGPWFEQVEVPFSDIDDETGFLWGFGVRWQFAERVSTAVEFTRHDVQVTEVDSFNLRLLFHP